MQTATRGECAVNCGTLCKVLGGGGKLSSLGVLHFLKMEDEGAKQR